MELSVNFVVPCSGTNVVGKVTDRQILINDTHFPLDLDQVKVQAAIDERRWIVNTPKKIWCKVPEASRRSHTGHLLAVHGSMSALTKFQEEAFELHEVPTQGGEVCGGYAFQVYEIKGVSSFALALIENICTRSQVSDQK